LRFKLESVRSYFTYYCFVNVDLMTLSNQEMQKPKIKDLSPKSKNQNQGSESGVNLGMHAPDFALDDGKGDQWQLSDKRGRVVVLLFYPGDETPICTRQMCSVRDRWDEYASTGAEVVGISMDTVESHEKFSSHHDLPLVLLSDADGEVSKSFDALSWFPGRSARAVIVIDKEGIIRYRKVQALSLFRPNDDDVLSAIKLASDDAHAAPRS
jgi:thioredoxin-dependent peroxiredoxin